MKTISLLKVILPAIILFLLGCEDTPVRSGGGDQQKVDLPLSGNLAQLGILDSAELEVENPDGTISIVSLKKEDTVLVGEIDPAILNGAKDVNVNVDVPMLEDVNFNVDVIQGATGDLTLEITGLTFTDERFGEVEVSLSIENGGVVITTDNFALNLLLASVGIVPGQVTSIQELLETIVVVSELIDLPMACPAIYPLDTADCFIPKPLPIDPIPLCSGYVYGDITDPNGVDGIWEDCIIEPLPIDPWPDSCYVVGGIGFGNLDTVCVEDQGPQIPLSLACYNPMHGLEVPDSLAKMCPLFDPGPAAWNCAKQTSEVNFFVAPTWDDLIGVYNSCMAVTDPPICITVCVDPGDGSCASPCDSNIIIDPPYPIDTIIPLPLPIDSIYPLPIDPICPDIIYFEIDPVTGDTLYNQKCDVITLPIEPMPVDSPVVLDNGGG